MQISKICSDFWKLRKNEFSGIEKMNFVSTILEQKEGIEFYGMNDIRYEQCTQPILSSFCVSSFKNVMPMVLNVLEKMLDDYHLEKESICMTYAPVDVFKLLNQIFDSYFYAEHDQVCTAILALIFR
jgi:hypothetical protein